MPNIILSCSAKRTVDTLGIIEKLLDNHGKLEIQPSLYYENSSENYFNVLAKVLDKYYKVLVVGHNASIEKLIEKITNRIEIIKLCSVARTI